MLDSTHYVYAWGKNKKGELSLGSHTETISTPQPVKCIATLEVTQLSSSGHHSALVTASGSLFLCGSGLHGKLGVETQHPNVLRFTRLQLQEDFRVKQVACGDYHTLCLLQDGRVLSWGGTLHKKTG